MNTKTFGSRLTGLASALVLVVAGTMWWAVEGRAAPESTGEPAAAPPHSVQDKSPKLDLDTKIFLHRNGRIVTSAALPLHA